MARWYQMFATKEEREAWEAEKKKQPGFRVCMRMTAKQLKKDLPFVDITGFNYATIWTSDT